MAESDIPAQPVRILIAEDSRPLRTKLARAAESAGHHVVAVETGAEALLALCEAPVDVIVADHFMPEMNGLHLLRVARLAWPGTARILMTGQADADLTAEAINAGQVHRFLTKPVDAVRLAATLRDVLRQVRAEAPPARRRRAA